MDHALQFGDINDLNALFEQGVSVDQTDFEGRTPLMMSTVQGKKDTVEMLLELGANVNYVFMYQGRVPKTALDAARESSKSEIEQMLLKYDAKTGKELHSNS